MIIKVAEEPFFLLLFLIVQSKLFFRDLTSKVSTILFKQLTNFDNLWEGVLDVTYFYELWDLFHFFIYADY